MNYHEPRFEDYTTANNDEELHPKMNRIYDKFPKSIHALKNVIFYGPSGTGKYTQLLKVIKRYSPSELKYERKISVSFNKQTHILKVSDVHFEIDMSLLGCNSKLLWHEIYQQIVDIVSAKSVKCGIVVCKYFHDIHNELLDNFYSYMQQNYDTRVDIKFILITEQISFIPDNILNCSEIIHISRPTKIAYAKCKRRKFPPNLRLEDITNIKMMYMDCEGLAMPCKLICNKIIQSMTNLNTLQFLKFRDVLYDLFIYNLDVHTCVWYILSTLIEMRLLTATHDLADVLKRTYRFFQYYNNNYRPIYHMESYFLYIALLIAK